MPITTHPSVVRAYQQPGQARASTLALAQAAQAQIFQVFGRMEMQGTGQATFTAEFPVMFVDPPQVSFGGELGGNQILVAGQYPTINILVRTWHKQKRAGHTYYSGADFVVVATGPADQTLLAHWQCEGVGLTNPLAGLGGVGDSI